MKRFKAWVHSKHWMYWVLLLTVLVLAARVAWPLCQLVEAIVTIPAGVYVPGGPMRGENGSDIIESIYAYNRRTGNRR